MTTRQKYMIAAGAVALLLLLPKGARAGSLANARDCSIPRGIRNNNPGNLRVSGSQWKGKVPLHLNTDYNCQTGQIVRSFEQFETWPLGVRALIVLLRGYIERDGLRTIQQIINKYAPPVENNTGSYVTRLASYAGISPTTPISFNKESMRRIVRGIALIENGQECVSNADFDAAWALI